MRRERMGPQIWDIIPALVAPVGARQQPEGGGGGGGGRWYISATLQSTLALGEIQTHYERQLRDATWTRTASSESGPVAWSTWTFTDEESESWRALFFVLQEPDEPNAYYLFLQAKSADSRRHGGFSSRLLGMQAHSVSHP